MKKSLHLWVGFGVLLGGCTTSLAVREAVMEADRLGREAVRDYRAKAKNYAPFEMRDDIYMRANVIPRRESKSLPQEWAGRTVVYESGVSVEFDEVTTFLSRLTGYAFREESINTGEELFLEHAGSLRSLLDKLATQLDAEWQFQDNVIVFSGSQTVVFTIHMPPFQVTGSASEAGHSSNFSRNVWNDLISGVERIIESNGGQGNVVPVEAAGQLIVTAKPRALGAVARFIEKENKLLARQIALEVELISVRVSDNDDYEFNLGAVLSDVFETTVNLGNITSSGTTAAAANMFLGFNRSGTGTLSRLATSLGGRTTTVLASNVSRTTMILMNGQSAPLEVDDEEAYVSSITRQQDRTTDETTVTYQTATLTTGLDIVVTPYISENESVVVNVAMNISQNLGFQEYGTVGSDNVVQLPNTRNRSFINQVVVPSGATLVAVGYESKVSNAEKSGVGHSSFFLLSGKDDSEIIRERLVIAITPVILAPLEKLPIPVMKTVSAPQEQERQERRTQQQETGL